nr:hypothetical protein [Tanacetum cinerariifolium]
DFAVTYSSVHSEARSWSIPSEDPYEEAAQQLFEQAPHSLKALGAEMNAIVLSLYHLLHPSGTPPLLHIPLSTPSTSRRARILEADTPPRNRPLLATPRPGCEVGESSADAARWQGPTMAHGVDCSYVETRLRDTERRMMAALELVNLRVLRSERLAYEQEGIQTREALARSEAYCRPLEARVAVLETHARRLEWQRQAVDDFADTMPPTNNGSTRDVQPPVVQIKTPILNPEPVVAVIIEPADAPVSALKPNQKLSIPYPSRLNDQKLRDKTNDQREKIFKIFQDLNFNISFANALILMPKFHFPADFVVVDFDADPRVPLILERSFLNTGRALIDVFEGELTLCVGREAITFNLDQNSRYSTNYNDMTANRIDIIDMAFRKEFKIYEAKTDKSSIDKPPEVEFKDLPPHLEYVFLEGDDKLPVIIAKDLSDEEKNALITVLKSHKRAIAWKLSDIKVMARTRRGQTPPPTNPNNPNNMTPEAVQTMIDQALMRNSGGGNGSHSSHAENPRNMHTARPSYYADFMKCHLLNFKRTEGAVGLTRWIKKMEFVFNISGGLPDNIYGNVKSSKPKTLDETIELANELMDQKLRTYAKRKYDSKRKADDISINNQQPFKKQNTYEGNAPKCTKCQRNHSGPCTLKSHKCGKIGHYASECRSTGNTNATNNRGGNGPNPRGNSCFECGNLGHFKRDCPKLNNKNGGNGNARSLIDIIPTPLDNHYDVELANGKIDWLRRHHAVIVCDEKLVRVPFGNETLVFRGAESYIGRESRLTVISCSKVQEYRAKGCHVFLAQISATKEDDKSEGKHFKDIDLILRAAPVARAPYRLAPSEMKELSEQLQELSDKVISCSKAQEYMAKGCQIFLAQISAKKEEDSSEGKQLEDVPVVRDFPEVFPKDLPGLPPVQPVEFQIDLIPGAAPVARSPYRLAPSEMKELSE